MLERKKEKRKKEKKKERLRYMKISRKERKFWKERN